MEGATFAAMDLLSTSQSRTLERTFPSTGPTLSKFARRLLQDGGGLSGAAIGGIAGGAAGCVVLIGVIIAVIIILRKKPASPDKDKVSKILISWKDIQIGPEIGLGGFGTVYKGMWQGNRVAVKMVRPDKVDHALLACLKEEALLMSELLHPSIARVYGLVAENPHYALVMHYYRRGTVEEFMNRPKQSTALAYSDLDIVQRLRMALQAAKGMQFLHARKPVPIVHGDLKTGNLLVDMDGRVVIADFGLARPLNKKLRGSAVSDVISIHITAPEVMTNPAAPRQSSADIYSFAIVLLEIVTGRPAYDERMPPKLIMRNVLRGERPIIPDTVQPVVADIIKACWVQEGYKRPSATDVVLRIERALQELQVLLPQYMQDADTSYL